MIFASWLIWTGLAQAYEAAYPMTEVGVCEIKNLPASAILLARSDREYFQENNGLFRKLFQAIQDNQIPMTTPVEAGMQPGTMIFYLDQASASRSNLRLAGVERKDVAERTVASLGIRGGYSKESYTESVAELRKWLAEQPDWQPAGQPYAVYWNSPFMIWFLKRSEVHLPVQRR